MRLAWCLHQAHVQPRFVAQYRANAGEDGAGPRAPRVAIGTRFWPRYPLADAVGQGRFAVQRGGDFHAHPGRLAHHAAEKSDIELTRFNRQRVCRVQNGDLYTGRPQSRKTLACNQRVGVGIGGNHLGNAGGNQRIAAGSGAAVVGARLQRDVSRGALHAVATCRGIAKGHHLGVRTTGLLGMAPAQFSAVGGDQHAADSRVGWRCQAALGGQLQGD